MKHRSVVPFLIGRQPHLAQALALALVLGGSVATTATANPGSMNQPAELQAQQGHAARQAQLTADAVRASAQTAGTTWYTSTCDDSGFGSLRYMVANAASGDTIDMSTISCNTINLNSRIIVSQNDLTLVGKAGYQFPFSFPGTYIHGSNSRGFVHNGTGTLTFQNINLSGRETTDYTGGGCIYSEGNVMIDRSYVHDCIANKSVGSSYDVKGGAIYAAGNVTLSGSNTILGTSSLVYDNVASAVDGNAYGGGIYAGGWVDIGTNSSVYGNLAESNTGNVYGGGIYGKGFVDLTASSSAVRDNKAETHGVNTQIKGAGIYTESSSFIYGKITGNEANTNTSVAVYIGEGGGIFAALGVTGYPGARFSDNHADRSSGGGIFTNGNLNLAGSTVADNSGLGTGAIFAKANVTIGNSTISGNRSRDSANIKLGPAATRRISIQSSTISNNTITNSSTNGAALNLQHETKIENSTIAYNIEKNATDTSYGAGISLNSNVNVDLKSTIVGDNIINKSSGSSTVVDIGEANGASGAAVTGGHNLITYTQMSIPTDTIWLQSPFLGPLADNGGPTKTRAPCHNSPTFENGDADSGILYDQRGVGFPRLVGGRVDIGAIESPDYRDIIYRNGFEEGECSS